MLATNLQEPSDQRASDAPPSMGLCYGNFINPKLRGLVWMDVMNGRRHPDDDSILEGDGHVMPRIAKKLQGGFQIDGIIEDAACNV